MASRFQFDSPDEALSALAQRLSTCRVDPDAIDLVGRTLARDVVADRDSPAADVSAMDGYAIRMSDLARADTIPVDGESAPGAPPPPLQEGSVVRIFTGAIVPAGCEAVVKREDTEELDAAIRLRESAQGMSFGEHIRRAGENARAGATVLGAGTRISAAVRTAMANFGCYHTDVYAPVRVHVITSGNEVGLFQDRPPEAWELRNSNRFALASLLTQPWIQLPGCDHCRDDAESLTELLRRRVAECDAVILTGGVSMGNYDYVPDAVKRASGEVVFHGLPIRPGKPILGAATAEGKLILGLPGNPVSATIGCHRFALPLLAKMNGRRDWNAPCPAVRLADPGDKSIPLHWLRLVRMTENGVAVPVLSQGSGDLVSLGQSTGYVQLPPGESGEGPWPYRSWDDV